MKYLEIFTMLCFNFEESKSSEELIISDIPSSLKRASAVIESSMPNSRGDNIDFIKNEKKIKSDDHFLSKNKLSCLSLQKEEINENSFIIQDNIDKNNNNNNKNKIEKKIRIDSNSSKREETKRLISEDDLFFEDILRAKLLKKAQSKYLTKNVYRMDALLIPFPEEPEYYNGKNCCKIKPSGKLKELEKEFKLKNFIIESEKCEDLIDLVNNKEEVLINKNINIEKEKFSIKEELFVGINIKKVDREKYSILYIFGDLIQKNRLKN